MSKLYRVGLIVLVLVLGVAGLAQAVPLTVGATYTISVAKLNSNGTVSAELASTTAVADADGKLVDFAISGLPDQTTCNFLVVSVKDGGGTTVRRALVPAAAAGGTVDIGISDLTETQAMALLAMAQLAATDDPIMMAFALVIVRSSNMTPTDAENMGVVGQVAIVSNDGTHPGFVRYLTDHGVTTTQLGLLRSALLNNTTVDLRAFTALFKNAVEAGDDTSARELQGEAGGKIASIFIAAAKEAGIDLQLVIDALDAAGDAAQSTANWSAIPASTLASIDGAMSAFHKGMALSKVTTEYTNALTLLNASGAQVTRFLNALADFATAQRAIDQEYELYYEDPVGHPMTDEVMAAQQDAWSSAWTAFQTAIESTADDLTALKASLAPYFGGDVNNVPDGLIHDYTMSGQVPVGINKAVALGWVLGQLNGGGSVSYSALTLTGDETTLLTTPHNGNDMSWAINNPPDYSGQGALAPYLQLQWDVQLCQAITWAQQNQAMDTYGQHYPGSVGAAIQADQAARLALRAAAITGTTDGTTAIMAAQKAALVKLLTQPQID